MIRSIRLRLLLLCAALAVGAILAVGAAMVVGAGHDGGGWSTAFAISAFALLGLVTLVWFVLDQRVARPLERLAADLRVRAHGKSAAPLDLQHTQHLGDLAFAADAVTQALGEAALATAQSVAAETRRLEDERLRLTALLTEIPVATLLINPDKRIVLYDGQAAEILAQLGTPRLMADLRDYFDRDATDAAWDRMARTGREVDTHISGRDGAQRYSVRLKPMDDGNCLIVIDDAEARLSSEAPRPIVYDFDLLQRKPPRDMAEMPLSELTYCVFDTETTGLLPHRDEIVQIGAVRVVNGRLVPGERFDELVDPGRPIPEASSRVHRITDAMVRGKPGIHEVGRRFHGFAEGAVIVAHNAPFDMAFLRRHAAETGVSWDHPILDTVLVSAVLFGTTEVHMLDALCTRLGVEIPMERRHTAMGDAEATAEALLRMIPMLEAQGLNTLGKLLEATRQHGRLLKDMN
ncbi:DNA polymerase-3 subunit epsilon [Tranquillimonas rosea]|uniref:DNA-directed DNA polymerase n=1 Tax=Tranquillimonas rosea TaxID=641238 RepID=A0A1H9TGH3_9RHOB|nr:3'-5' exonuclease [Tranquillimonas rosea]SER96074.1 DNA polymerase-3 subunit epsilon [Tranquillimonas rosea]